MLQDFAVLIIFVSSLLIFWSCVCRLNLTHKGVYARVRWRYSIIGTGSLFAAFGPFIFPNGLYGVAIFFAAHGIGFVLDRKDWAHGVPESATQPGSLDGIESIGPPVH